MVGFPVHYMVLRILCDITAPVVLFLGITVVLEEQSREQDRTTIDWLADLVSMPALIAIATVYLSIELELLYRTQLIPTTDSRNQCYCRILYKH